MYTGKNDSSLTGIFLGKISRASIALHDGLYINYGAGLRCKEGNLPLSNFTPCTIDTLIPISAIEA